MIAGESKIIQGTVGTAAVNVLVTNNLGRPSVARRIVFKNEHASQTLSVSTDDGANFTTLAAGEQRELFGNIVRFLLKASGASTAYSASMTVA